MSDFSEKCREILLSTGTNVYQVSQMSGLDRTSLQRMITGKRLPRFSFVREFCEYLRIDSEEKKELLELYEAERIGKAAFSNRKCAEKFLTGLNRKTLMPAMAPLCTESRRTVETFLENCFLGESAFEIFTNLPGSEDFFYQEILRLKKTLKRELPVYHLLDFHPDPGHFPEGRKNIETISGLLTPFFNGYFDYHPRCFYTKTEALSNSLLFPYYLGSKNGLLLFPADFSFIFQLRDPYVCRTCYEEFFHLWEDASPFILPSYESGTDPSFCTSAPLCCGLNYLPQNSERDFSGAWDSLYFFSPYTLAKVSFKKRKDLLNGCGEVKKESIFLLKDEMLSLKNICMRIFSDYTYIITFPVKGERTMSVYVKESGSGSSFRDYFTALSQGEAVYTDSQKTRILDWIAKTPFARSSPLPF